MPLRATKSGDGTPGRAFSTGVQLWSVNKRKIRDLRQSSVDAPSGLEAGVTVLDELVTQADGTEPVVDNRVVEAEDDENVLRFRSSAFYLTEAALVGSLTGLSVAIFKLSIEGLREVCYQQPFLLDDLTRATVPAAGGLAVGLLYLAGGGEFPPGLRQTIQQVDTATLSGVLSNFRDKLEIQLDFLRKSAAAVFTLGTGASLGPGR